MITTRSNWAATTPWDGIQNKPSSFPSAAPDIGQVGGKGFANGNIPVWNSSLKKFVPGSRTNPSPTPTPTPTPSNITAYAINFFWDAPSILPMQSCYEDFPFIGAQPSDPVCVGAPFDLEFCQASAIITELNNVRLTIFNGNINPVDLSDGVWKIVRFSII